jgi:hypothetical protein
MPRLHRSLVGVLAVLTSTVLCASQASAAKKAKDLQPPIDKGLRVVSCGHSFHMFVVPMLKEMAQGAGIEGHDIPAKSGIGGSRVIQHWDVPDENNNVKKVLKEGGADVLTLAPIWLPEDGIEKFVKLGLEHNPNLRIMVQEFWLPNDEYHPVYPLETRKGCDHNATKIEALTKAQSEYDRDLGALVRSLNTEAGKQSVFLVPVGQAAIALRERIVAGTAPGIKTQGDLFRDPWGHAQPPLQVLSGYCHFATIYRRSPVGLPVPTLLAKMEISDADKEQLNKLLQELAWEAVVNHPLSGLTRGSG